VHFVNHDAIVLLFRCQVNAAVFIPLGAYFHYDFRKRWFHFLVKLGETIMR